MDNSESDEIRRRRKTMDLDTSQKMNGNGVNEKSEKLETRNDTMDSMSETHVRQRMEKLRNEFVDHITNQFDDMMSDVINDLEGVDKFDAANARRLDNSEKLYSDKRKVVESGILPEKEFLRRNSVLTDLYEIQHFRTIYNIFISILIVISLHTVIWDWLHIGSIYLGWNLVTRGFAKISKVIEIWLMMLLSTFVVYRCFNYWAQQRVRISPRFYRRKLWDFGWLVLFIAYQIVLIVHPAQLIIWAALPPVSRVIILTETVRMAMKMHAFVRSVAPIALAYKPHSDDEQAKLPGFSKFLYFMFAPTLVYRETYPRTKEIRWRFVVWHLFEVALVIFNMAFIFERYLIPPFEDFGKHPIDVKTFVLKVYGTAFPGILVFLSGFYCLLHAWMNAAAEVTRFGDRLFYKDWWNAAGYTSYYRRWNVVVHDWLYTYIYKDLYEIVIPGNRFIPTWTVFFVSAVFHEYIIGVAFSFFFPVMLLQFGVLGFLLIFLRMGKTIGNIFLWFSLCTGSGAMISFYAVEYFARVNCPKSQENFMDFLLPRSYNCF